MRRFLLLLILVFPASFVFSQSENIRYVAVQTETLKESAGFFAKNIGSLSLGDVVMLIGGQGKWAQVRSQTLSGWILSSSLSVRRIVSSGTGASATEISLAGKGFSAAIELEYRKTGINYSMVDFMENIKIAPEELLTFITEGRLARGE